MYGDPSPLTVREDDVEAVEAGVAMWTSSGARAKQSSMPPQSGGRNSHSNSIATGKNRQHAILVK